MSRVAYPEVRFGTSPTVIVAYAERRGAYSGVGESMAELSRWLGAQGVSPSGDPFCLFFDNPGETPED